MADNFTTNAGSGGNTFASDDVSSVQYPRVKRSLGRDGQAADCGTLYRFASAASTNTTNVKASAGALYLITAVNLNAAVRYLKLYNKASAPTLASDTPVMTLPIPGNTAGAGFVIPIECGADFSTGISFAITTGAADNDTGAIGANEVFLTLSYV
jgi:hypothetical protein